MKLRLSHLIAMVLLATLISGAAVAETLRIHTRLTVTGDIITLGDVFGIVGDGADVVVAQAPLPGKRQAIGVNRIRMLARTAGLDWKPPFGLDRIIVTRASRRISDLEITARVRDELALMTSVDNLRIELANRGPELHVAVGASTMIDIENITYDARSGRFVASLIAAPDTADAVRAEIRGRAIEIMEVPVLSTRLRRGDIIGEDDIQWIEWPVSRLAMGTVTDDSDLLGFALRRSLTPGQPVRERDIEEPVVVAKGSTVMLVYRTAVMVMSASGKALDDGAMGATIRVLNSHSKMVVEATVEGGSVVSVSLAPRLALN